jgi:hypothetical protein
MYWNFVAIDGVIKNQLDYNLKISKYASVLTFVTVSLSELSLQFLQYFNINTVPVQ